MAATARQTPQGSRTNAAQRELARRELAKRDFAFFGEYAFGWPAGAVPLHLAWDKHIDESWAAGLNPGILAPRDHAKTTRMLARVVWELGRSTMPRFAWWPDLRVKLFQNTDTKAMESIILVRNQIRNNPRIRAVFPKLVPDPDSEWSQHRLYIKRKDGQKDASFEGRAILSAATGGRADLIILDDVCDFKNSVLEPATRDKILAVLNADIVNLGEPQTRKIAIGTAWHELDANAALQKNPTWRWQVWRIQDEPGAPMRVLWPGKWDIPALERRLEEIGHLEFNRGFNNWPLGEEESIVNWESVKACMDPSITLGERPFSTGTIVAGYDLAIGKSDQASYFAATVLGRSGDGRIIPLEMVRTRCPFRQQVDTIKRIDAQWKPVVHVVENNAYQQALVDQVRQEAEWLNVEEFTTGKQKSDPFIGLPSIGPVFDQHKMVIPTGGGHDGMNTACECSMCAFLRELRWFPASTTDMVMSFWFALSRIRTLVGRAEATVKVQEATVAAVMAAEKELW